MTKEQIDCIRQIAETAGLLNQQLSKLADLSEVDSYASGNTPKSHNREVELFVNQIDSIYAEREKYPLMYYGAPSGNGFEESSELPAASAKCLYVIQKTSENTAKFYPIPEKLPRFKMNPNSLFNLVCMAVGNIEDATYITTEEKDYGELEYSNGYWKVIKKCIVLCN